MRETGRIKLIVDKWGKVEHSSEKVGALNHAHNISAVEYELVPAEGAERQGGRGGRGGRGNRGGRGGQRRDGGNRRGGNRE